MWVLLGRLALPRGQCPKGETPVQIETTQKNGVIVVRMKARELAYSVCEEFQHAMEELLASGHSTLLIDFSTIEFMDSSGIGTLISLRNKAHEKGGEVALARIAASVQKVLRITQLDKIFPVYDELEHGVRELAAR